MNRVSDRAGWRAATAATLMLLLATGCSDEEPPSRSVPALEEQLDKVDEAIEKGDLEEARKAVDELATETTRARIEGDITEDQADRILEAVEDVVAELPEPEGKGDE